MQTFSQAILCGACGKYLSSVMYVAESQRDYSHVRCSACAVEAKAVQGPPENKALQAYTVKELRELAQEAGIKLPRNATRAEIEKALEGYQVAP